MYNMDMYRLVIFDLDGTAIPNKPEGMPSEHLVEVVGRLRKSGVKVCAATGRPRFNSKPITDKLGLTDPCIISGGTQIVDPLSGKILWEKGMTQEQVETIVAVALPYDYKLYFSDEELSLPAREKTVTGTEGIIYIMTVGKVDTETIMQHLSTIPNITAHRVMSWTPDHFDIHITHREATKKHALEVLLDMLHVKKEEVIAAGDSNNDLPLFELAGYKIAMGNGSQELKGKADMIVLNAEDDGLAIAIEKVVGEVNTSK